MLTRLSYFARETWVSLRRNTMMTIAGVLTVAVSLCVLGGSLMITRLVDHGTQRWKDGVQFIIFMNPKAPSTQTEAVQTALGKDPDVARYKFTSHQQAYEDFKKFEADSPDLVSITRPSDLNESFSVIPKKAELSEQIAARYKTAVGVDQVQTAAKEVHDLLTTVRWIRLGFVTIFVALLFASLFLIVNTIRLATFARRREIEVMKLVGASNWFVRVPFMFEGMVQGLLGAVVGVFAVWGLQRVLTDAIPKQSNFWTGWYVNTGDAFQISLIVLLLGAGIGALGAFVGLRRFLDV
ncbi:MAG: permease-like cell division protein FtsX [Acidimicrobiia bacterium]